MKAILHRNFVPWNRNWTVVRRHLPIVLKPLIAGLAMVALWKFIVLPSHVHFNDGAKDPILFIVFPLVSFIYVIFASVAVTSVFEQYKAVSRSVVKKDVDAFLLYRDEQLPIMMHLLIGAPSFIISFFLLFFDYGNQQFTAAATIFSVTFMLILIWVIATELDDFSKSIWFSEKVPRHWYEIDVEEHFRKKGQ